METYKYGVNTITIKVIIHPGMFTKPKTSILSRSYICYLPYFTVYVHICIYLCKLLCLAINIC